MAKRHLFQDQWMGR